MTHKKSPLNRYLVTRDKPVVLAKRDPDETRAFPVGKGEGKHLMRKLTLRLEVLQELLHAGQKHRFLVIFQGMDTSGKDGTIKHVFSGVDPMGVRVAAFKTPTEEERQHDFLWRIEKELPRPGEIVLFNRSHYEDVLIVRVDGLAPEEEWSKRYDLINEFEKRLAGEGVTILKFFLNIDPVEQKERLQSRLDDPTKRWKFSPDDLQDRKLWPQYIQAYQDVLNRTSFPWAPWYIVPANRKWYRNLVVSAVIVETLERLSLKYPKLPFDPRKVEIE
jgi:PPK2 family polyphosphate:nucleotide phosphotransferase